MKKVFVSGAFNVLHAGHIRFFEDARSLGDYLIVSYPSADLLWELYTKKSTLDDADKKAVISSLQMVDEVIESTDQDVALSFKSAFIQANPQVLAVTTDDQYMEEKRRFCEEQGVEFVVLEKSQPENGQVTSSQLLSRVKAPVHVPLRVDFAGRLATCPKMPCLVNM